MHHWKLGLAAVEQHVVEMVFSCFATAALVVAVAVVVLGIDGLERD